MSLPDALIDSLGMPGLVSLYAHSGEVWDFLLPHIYNGIVDNNAIALLSSIEGQFCSRLSFLEGHNRLGVLAPSSADQAIQWMIELESGSLHGERISHILSVFEDAKWSELMKFLPEISSLAQVCQIFMLFEPQNRLIQKKFGQYFKFMADFCPISPIKDENGAVKWLKTAMAINRDRYSGGIVPYIECEIEFLGA